MANDRTLYVATFATELGWLALAGAGGTVWQITFARASRQAALAALLPEVRARARAGDWNPALVRRLQDFAAGAPDDFRDVRLDLAHLTPFQKRVVEACRAIGYGQSCSYGALAAAAGNARAARAVGNTMRANRFALVVPCHRVVHAGGDVGPLSACARFRKKLRLLEATGRPPQPLPGGRRGPLPRSAANGAVAVLRIVSPRGRHSRAGGHYK
jgi:methylated-DNA-[protein]-cysteine S-methyltransferase